MAGTAEIRSKASLDNSGFITGLKGMQRETEAWSKGSLDPLKAAIRNAFSATAVLALIGVVKETVEKMAEFGDEVDGLSKRTQLSTETVQSMGVVCKQTGLEFGALEASVQKLTRSQAEALIGDKAAVAAFDAMGISIKELRSLSPEALFELVARTMAKSGESAAVTAASYDLLGKGAGRASEIIKQMGAEGFAELNQRMLETGQISSAEVIDKLAKMDEIFDSLGRKSKSYTASLVVGVAEMLRGSEAAWMTDEELKQIVENQAWIAEKVKVEADARTKIAELSAQHEAISKAVAEYEKVKAAELAKQMTSQEKIAALTTKIADEEKQVRDLMTGGTETLVQRTEIETQMLKDKGALLSLEQQFSKEAETHYQTVLKEWDALDKKKDLTEEILGLEKKLGDDAEAFRISQLTDAGKLGALIHKRYELEAEINAMQKAGVVDTLELLRVQGELQKVNQDILLGTKQSGQVAEKTLPLWDKMSVKQVETLVALKDALHGMSNDKIDEFLNSLKRLADGLPKDGIDLGWMEQLSGLRLPTLRPQEVGTFHTALDLLITSIGDLDFSKLKELGSVMTDMSGFHLPSFSTGSFIKSLNALLLGIADKDLSKLKEIAGLFTAMGGAGPGTYKITIDVPNSISLTVPETYSDNLDYIGVQLAALVGMKGIIWA